LKVFALVKGAAGKREIAEFFGPGQVDHLVERKQPGTMGMGTFLNSRRFFVATN